jgi:hypothetical protein
LTSVPEHPPIEPAVLENDSIRERCDVGKDKISSHPDTVRRGSTQIDRAFALKTNNFVLEAKWQTATPTRSDLDAFAAMIAAKSRTRCGCSSRSTASSRAPSASARARAAP